MAILKLITYPDPLLKQISEPVEKITPDIQKFMDDMVETMYHEEGVGLAAVQVGVLKRILVIDLADKDKGEKNKLYHMVNPVINKTSDTEVTRNEGCLSFPGARAEITRPEAVTVTYLDYNGVRKTLDADGWMATAVQHEMDHLNGITFPDHLSRLKKELVIRKVLKLKKLSNI